VCIDAYACVCKSEAYFIEAKQRETNYNSPSIAKKYAERVYLHALSMVLWNCS
jgi:hypothetical protein